MDDMAVLLTWLTIALMLVLTGLVILVFLTSNKKTIKEVIDKTAADMKLRKMLEAQPQSGLWIACSSHGQVSIPQALADKGQCCCPYCGKVPFRIWRKTAKG
jgi:hypothetical protein